MDDKTLEALKGSIAKWQAIVDGTGEDWGPINCPLCLMFHPKYAPNDGREKCDGCPVKERTGHAYCENTPYHERSKGDEREESMAKEELDFLISLLPHADGDEQEHDPSIAP